jgi:hypothetical protein
LARESVRQGAAAVHLAGAGRRSLGEAVPCDVHADQREAAVLPGSRRRVSGVMRAEAEEPEGGFKIMIKVIPFLLLGISVVFSQFTIYNKQRVIEAKQMLIEKQQDHIRELRKSWNDCRAAL